MIVYVSTSEQIDLAFQQWIDETKEDDRRIVHLVYKEFMLSDCAKAYNTVSGLTSFNLDDWQIVFRQWIDQEIIENPGNAADIRKWSSMLIDLISSDWGINHKLIVRECLDGEFCNKDEYRNKIVGSVNTRVIIMTVSTLRGCEYVHGVRKAGISTCKKTGIASTRQTKTQTIGPNGT
jgi:hypothetical protein